MFLRLTTIIKQRVHPFVVLGVSLAAVVAVTSVTGIWHNQHELKHQVQKGSSAAVDSGLQVASAVPATHEIAVQPDSPAVSTGRMAGNTASHAAPRPANSLQNAQQSPQEPLASPALAANHPVSQATPAPVTISLSVNDVHKGNVTLAATANQCDVLQKALDSGVISSLDMRYSSQYKTYAVYVIEGQGDSGSIWWTYTVNGKSPPYGCSGTKVAAGDSVNWKYVKQ